MQNDSIQRDCPSEYKDQLYSVSGSYLVVATAASSILMACVNYQQFSLPYDGGWEMLCANVSLQAKVDVVYMYARFTSEFCLPHCTTFLSRSQITMRPRLRSLDKQGIIMF